MIYIGSDHGGFALKQELIKHLQDGNIPFTDLGAYDANPVDYPDIAKTLCETVLDKNAMGLLICGTGIGMSIAANKIKGIRAALCNDSYSARMARAHNNANILVLGGRVTGPELAKDILDRFLNTKFDGGRHEIRVNKIGALEQGC